MSEVWFAIKVIVGFSVAVCAIVGISAVLLDRRQRRYQRAARLDAGPSDHCVRRYVP